MTISLASYAYLTGTGNLIHKTLVAPKFDLPEAIITWWGVRGAAIRYGLPRTRVLTMDVWVRGYASEALLRAAVYEIQTHVMDSGTLTVDSINWPACAFLGFEPADSPMLDGSGVNGWVQPGKLTWRQIAQPSGPVVTP